MAGRKATQKGSVRANTFRRRATGAKWKQVDKFKAIFRESDRSQPVPEGLEAALGGERGKMMTRSTTISRQNAAVRSYASSGFARVALVALLTVGLAGCTTNDTGETSRTKTGALIGAITGALAGAAAGGSDHRAEGALIGAAAGAVHQI